MPDKPIVPCLWLDDQAEEAAAFYSRTFPRGRVFGLSWQVVPRGMAERVAGEDGAGRDRAFRSMLGMGELDVAALRAAFEGR